MNKDVLLSLNETPDFIRIGGDLYRYPDSEVISIGFLYKSGSKNELVYIGLDRRHRRVICNDEDIKKYVEDRISRYMEAKKENIYYSSNFVHSKVTGIIGYDELKKAYHGKNYRELSDRVYKVLGKYYITYWNSSDSIRKYRKYVDYLIEEMKLDKNLVYIQSMDHRHDEYELYSVFFGDVKDNNIVDQPATNLQAIRDKNELIKRLHMIKTQLPSLYKKQIDKL